MKRRDFLRMLLSTPIAATLDIEQLLWIPGEKTIFIPSQRQIDFLYGGMAGGGKCVSLYGIPYHYLNATVGYWLVFPRIKDEKLL